MTALRVMWRVDCRWMTTARIPVQEAWDACLEGRGCFEIKLLVLAVTRRMTAT